MRRRKALLLICALLALLGCGQPAPPPTPIPPGVRLDASGARGFIDFLRGLEAGRPWDEGAIRQLVASPPYQALLAHHSSLDSRVTFDALVQVLLAVRDGKRYSSPSARLTRIYAAYRAACRMVPTLEARLEELADPAQLASAVRRAQGALPPQARLTATVYVLADGYSPTYVGDDAIILDVLQIAGAAKLDLWLAHELHHSGVSSLLPAPCGDPAAGMALDVLAGLVQEGAATYFVEGWRGRPTAEDYERMQAFLGDVLQGKLSQQETEARLAEVLGEERGPLYRVGNAMIARLAAVHGEAWVRARLGDPVGLLRAYRRAGGWPTAGRILILLDWHGGRCTRWLGGVWGRLPDLLPAG